MRPLFKPAALLAAATLCLVLGACHDAKVFIPPNLRPPSDTGDALAKAKQHLQDATPCCTSFADFSYRSLLPWQPKRFVLGPNSPVANLNGVRSHFLAFKLPPDLKMPYRVAIKAELNGRWLHSSYLFAPTTVVLDEAFQPIDSKDIPLCEYMGWSKSTTGAFGSTTIDDPKARYLVVYSSGDQQSGNTYWEQSPAAFSAEAPVNMTSKGSFKIPHGPDGTLWVGLMNDSYKTAVDQAVCGEAPQGDGLLKTLGNALPTRWVGSAD
jgi:hypothetical protein